MNDKRHLSSILLSVLAAVLLLGAVYYVVLAGDGDWGTYSELTRSSWGWPADNGPTNVTGMLQYTYGTKGGLLEIEIQGDGVVSTCTYTLEPYIELATLESGTYYFAVGPYTSVTKPDGAGGKDHWHDLGIHSYGTANANHRIWISVTIVSTKTWIYEFRDCDTTPATIITKGRVDLPAGYAMGQDPDYIATSNEFYEVSYDSYAREELHKGDGNDWVTTYGDPDLSNTDGFVFHRAVTETIATTGCEDPATAARRGMPVCSTRPMGNAAAQSPPPPFTPEERAEIEANFLRKDSLPPRPSRLMEMWNNWFYHSWLYRFLLKTGLMTDTVIRSGSGWARMESWYVPNAPPTPAPRATLEP